MRPQKTWERLLRHEHRNIAFADLVRLVEAFGFVERRISGSHRIFSHPDVPRPLSLQPVKGEAKPYQIAQFVGLVEQYGLVMRSRP